MKLPFQFDQLSGVQDDKLRSILRDMWEQIAREINQEVPTAPSSLNASRVSQLALAALPLTTKGDLLTREVASLVRLPVGGTNGFVLQVDSAESTGLKWATVGAASLPLSTKGDFLTYDGVDLVRLGVGADGYVPTADATKPYGWDWAPLPGGGSGILSLNLLMGSAQTLVVGTAGADFAITSVGSVHTFDLPDAGAAARGVLTTTAQTIAGQKTFSGGIDVSNAGGLYQGGVQLLSYNPAGGGRHSLVNLFGITAIGTLNINVVNATSYIRSNYYVDASYYKISAETGTAGFVLRSDGVNGYIGAQLQYTDLGGSPTLTVDATSPIGWTGLTLNMPDASATYRGVVSTGSQTFAGQKTFSEQVIGTVGFLSRRNNGDGYVGANVVSIYLSDTEEYFHFNSTQTNLLRLVSPAGTTVMQWNLQSSPAYLGVASTIWPIATYDLGTTDYRWRKLWVQDIDFNGTMTGGTLPSHVHSGADITSGIITLARGGTGVDLSTTGGAIKILAQDASHVISARNLVSADIPWTIPGYIGQTTPYYAKFLDVTITGGLSASSTVNAGYGYYYNGSGGTAGFVLRSDGASYKGAALQSADIPWYSPGYIGQTTPALGKFSALQVTGGGLGVYGGLNVYTGTSNVVSLSAFGYLSAGTFIDAGLGSGFSIYGAAPSGHFLKGNGTRYVDGTIQVVDITNLKVGSVVLSGGMAVISTGLTTITSIIVTLRYGTTPAQYLSVGVPSGGNVAVYSSDTSSIQTVYWIAVGT
jgi:hypothetical protein